MIGARVVGVVRLHGELPMVRGHPDGDTWNRQRSSGGAAGAAEQIRHRNHQPISPSLDLSIDGAKSTIRTMAHQLLNSRSLGAAFMAFRVVASSM